MKEIEAEGKTIEEAISKALAEMKAEQEDVEVKIIDEGKAGLFGLMGATPARVRVTLKDQPTSPAQTTAVMERAQQIVNSLLAKMQVDGESRSTSTDNNIIVTIESLDSALLIGKKGQTLEALQYIVNLILNREIKADAVAGAKIEDKYKVIIDTEGYRGRREEALVKLAKNLAEKVVQTGRKEALEPMSAHDRRVIHLALKETAGIRTESEGEGSFRRIVISPEK
jgi:spoIIIJ-associated protein